MSDWKMGGLPGSPALPNISSSLVTTTGESTARTAADVIQPMVLPAAFDMVIAGDSIAAFIAGQRWSDLVEDLSQFKGRVVTNTNTAVAGRTISDLVTGYATEVYPLRPAVVGRPVYLFVSVGSNDLQDGGAGVAATVSAVQAYWATAVADGFTVVAFTVLPRGTTASGAYNNGSIEAYNSQIRASTGYSYLCDIALVLADPYDTALFNTDRIHPLATGHVLLAGYINSVFGGRSTPRAIFTGRRGGNGSFASDLNSLGDVTTGLFLTATGARTLWKNTTGINNSAFGAFALSLNTTGTHNTGIGTQSLAKLTEGLRNTGCGNQVMFEQLTGDDNTGVGHHAMFTSTGDQNTAVGSQALYYNEDADNNVGVGFQSAYRNTTGNANTAVGTTALQNNQTGANNTAVGYQSLLNATAGFNTAIGSLSLNSTTSATQNTGLGYGAGRLTTGSNNTAVGALALYNNTTGANNVAVGTNSGRFQADGSTALIAANSTYVGTGVRGLNNSDVNATVIGYNAIGEGANITVIGNTSTTRTHVFGDLQIGAAGSPTISFATAAPASGTWIAGSVVWNTSVAVGQPNGWRCTVAGTPGTWVAMANL